MRRLMSLLFLMILVCPVGAYAQVSTMASPVGAPIDTGRPLDELDRLTDLYNNGKWHDLQAASKALLDSTRAAATRKSAAKVAEGVDYSRHYVIVTWLATDPFGKTMLARVIVHTPSAKEPFLADLPGVDGDPGEPHAYEVFFSRGLRGKVVSVYASSRDKDPFAEQLPAFVQAVASPLFAAVGAFAGKIDPKATPPPRVVGEKPPPKPTPPTIGATVSFVGLPFKRATVKWKAVAKEPVEVDAFGDEVDSFAQTLTFDQGARSKCARSAIDPLLVAVKGTAASPECAGPTATAGTCKSRFDEVISETVVIVTTAAQCVAASKEDMDAVREVETKFRAQVATTLTNSAEAELTFKNRPLTHWSFGAGSGVLAKATLTKPRVIVDEGNLAADPLDRVVTMAFVNWSPKGYDSELESVTAAERLRPFFGVTITPDFGLTTGVNVVLERGIGLTVGAVLLFAKGAESHQIGLPPANPDVPYRVSYARGYLIGISYTFK